MADQTFDFQQTGQTLQERFNQVPTNTEAIAALQQAITAFLNTEQVQALIATALQPYSTTSETNTAISTAITQALASYYTKTAIDTLIAGYYTKQQVDNLLAQKTDATQVATAISTALNNYYTKTQVDGKLSDEVTARNQAIGTAVANAVSDLTANIKNGSIVAKLAENLESWEGRDGLSVEDTFSDRVRTAAGDVSIDSEQGAKLVSINAKSDFYATQLKTTGFNLLHGATAVGSGYYFLVPALPFGSYGTAAQPNGVLFTNQAGENLKPTVVFKPMANGVPASVTDGTVCPYVDSNGLRFYCPTEPGYIVVSGITLADTCAHIGWSRRYNEFISPSAAADAGGSIALSTIINAVHSYNLLLNVAGAVSDGIVFSDSVATWYRNCDRIQPSWANTPVLDSDNQPTGSYKHTATIEAMKENGAAECGSLTLTISGKTVSYTDTNSVATTDYVKFELASPVTGTVSMSNTLTIEDWGLEELLGATGTAYVTIQYAQNYPDALAGIASVRFTVMLRVLVEAVAWLAERCQSLEKNTDNLGNAKAISIDCEEMPKVCGMPMVVEGTGAPTAPQVPAFVGQRYHDTTNKKVYEAFSVTNSINDWVLLN